METPIQKDLDGRTVHPLTAVIRKQSDRAYLVEPDNFSYPSELFIPISQVDSTWKVADWLVKRMNLNGALVLTLPPRGWADVTPLGQHRDDFTPTRIKVSGDVNDPKNAAETDIDDEEEWPEAKELDENLKEFEAEPGDGTQENDHDNGSAESADEEWASLFPKVDAATKAAPTPIPTTNAPTKNEGVTEPESQIAPQDRERIEYTALILAESIKRARILVQDIFSDMQLSENEIRARSQATGTTIAITVLRGR
jgi:hypothetical protein